MISHLTVRLLRLPVRAALAAAHDTDPSAFRELTVVAAHVDGDLDTVAGWGECAALNTTGYMTEWARGAFGLLAAGCTIDARRWPMAAAALDMARLDARLRDQRRSLADHLGTCGATSRAGAVVGLGKADSVVAEVEALVDEGFERIKLKIAPGSIAEPVAAVRARFPDVEIQVDANGSLTADDLEELIGLADLGVVAIEQPFAPEDRSSAARLVAGSELEIIADEAARSVDDIDALAAAGAATAIALKPPTVGGIEAGLAMVKRAHARGLRTALGGMLESGLGRHCLAAFGPVVESGIAGDLSPARRWLEADPFPDISMVDGHIPVPDQPGIVPAPDLDVLAAHTLASTVVDAAQM